MTDMFGCGHPKSPENARVRPSDGRVVCRECGRLQSQRWKDRNREANRARDRAYIAAPEQRGICDSPICTRLRGSGALRRGEEGYCKGCYDAVYEVRRTLAEGMWADGWTCREMAEAFGISKPTMGAEIASWRQRGYMDGFPHRRTPEQVARIKAGWQRVVDERAAA